MAQVTHTNNALIDLKYIWGSPGNCSVLSVPDACPRICISDKSSGGQMTSTSYLHKQLLRLDVNEHSLYPPCFTVGWHALFLQYWKRNTNEGQNKVQLPKLHSSFASHSHLLLFSTSTGSLLQCKQFPHCEPIPTEWSANITINWCMLLPSLLCSSCPCEVSLMLSLTLSLTLLNS